MKAYFHLARTMSPGVHSLPAESILRWILDLKIAEEIGLEIKITNKFTSFLLGLGDRNERGSWTKILQAVLCHCFVYSGLRITASLKSDSRSDEFFILCLESSSSGFFFNF